jgi:PPOX class probable F420-dependent enzyme
VPSGDALVAITQEKSWKVKRIRNTSRVTIAECDVKGNPKGEAVEAVASILDKSANGATYSAISKRYGLIGKGFTFFSKLRGGMKNNVSIELKAVN